jgi:hypothetical protein
MHGITRLAGVGIDTMRSIALLGVCLIAPVFLVGCANNSGAYRIGDNLYEVSTRATWELGGRAGAKRMALDEATKTCSSQAKNIKVISDQEDYGHFEGGTVDLKFSCE